MGTEIRWGMRPHSIKIRRLYAKLAMLLLFALPAAAQLQIGDYTHLNMNGNLGFTYAGGINQGSSDHSMGFSGNTFLNGYYYSPNFLNFNVTPFYNREQTNNIFGNLTNTAGVSSNLSLFSGSHFPGSVSYNRSYNGISAFGVPGADLGLAQRTDMQGLGFGWSALIPGLPTLTALYSINDTSNNILGTPGNDTDSSKILNLLSNYRWDGFTMTGQFTHRNDDAKFSEFLETGGAPVQTLSSSNSIGATISHALPLTGNFGVSYNRLSYGYQLEDSSSVHNSGDSNTLNGVAAFHPTNKLGFSFNGGYNTSLLGAIPQAIVNSGAQVNLSTADSYRSEIVGTDVFYQIWKHLGLHADVQHQRQTFLGETFSATQFGGSVNFDYDHGLLKGLSFSVGATDTAQQQNNTGLGFVGNLNYSRKFGNWTVGSNFAYSQNTQTVLLIYTTSSYSYLGSLNRRIGSRSYWMLGYSGAHSGLSANSGTTSSAERVWTGYIWRGNSLNVYYNTSTGQSIFTATGLVLVPTTLPTQLLAPNSFSTFNSKGWGASLGANPTRRLTLTAAFAKSDGSTIDPLLRIYTNNTLYNALMQYRMRKIFLNAGYTRLQQSVTTPGGKPLVVTTYFVGFSRWFNFF